MENKLGGVEFSFVPPALPLDCSSELTSSPPFSTSLDDSLENVRNYLKIKSHEALSYPDALESTALGRRGRKSKKIWHIMSFGLVILLGLRGLPST